MELLVYLTTNEVDDEAAVAVAAGGAAAEESHAVGRAHDDVEDVVPPEDDGVVAGVREGVAEGEDGVERAPPRTAAVSAPAEDERNKTTSAAAAKAAGTDLRPPLISLSMPSSLARSLGVRTCC